MASPPDPVPFEDVAQARERIATQLSDVERIVPVMSGKGGVGKSAVSVNLSLALARAGDRVGILDADLNGPSVATMLGLRGQPVRMAGELLRPVPGPRGLAVQGMDFFLQGSQPLDWDGAEAEAAAVRSALEDAALADFLGRTEWGELDALVIDLPPGADRLPALARLLPRMTGCVAVTIPTEVALLAVERSLRRAWEVRAPVIGLVENMSFVTCARCGADGPLFREAPVDRVAGDLDVPVVARIPFDAGLAAAADAGRSFLEGEAVQSTAGRAFATLAERVRGFDAEEWESW